MNADSHVEPSTISIYPVGVLAAIKHRRVQSEYRYIRTQVAARKWRAVRQSFNGYLAEIDYPPSALIHNHCGHGWTKRRAARRLGEYLARDNRVSQ